MKYLEKIQVLLPLGYLYLILLGLLNESILYYQLGINVLHYSSITDILINPISEMFSSPSLLLVLLGFILFFLLIRSFLVRNSHTGWGKKLLGANRFNPETSKKEMRRILFPVFVLCVGLELLAIFVGLGLGRGRKIAEKIKHNKYTYNYKVEFSSGKTEKVYLFDLNSSYCFYVTKASKNIHIAPVGTISSLELINNPELGGKPKNQSVRRH